MRMDLSIKLTMVAVLILIIGAGCTSNEKGFSQKDFEKQERIEDNMDKTMEENLDEDLNPTEQKAVNAILEKGSEDRKRRERTVFGIPDPKQKKKIK